MFTDKRESKVSKFIDVYKDTLAQVIKLYPQEYMYGIDQVPTVVERMRQAFIRGTYNYDGQAIKLACKQLGIKHTRKAMELFFNS